jgi:hypothetical protein
MHPPQGQNKGIGHALLDIIGTLFAILQIIQLPFSGLRINCEIFGWHLQNMGFGKHSAKEDGTYRIAAAYRLGGIYELF